MTKEMKCRGCRSELVAVAFAQMGQHNSQESWVAVLPVVPDGYRPPGLVVEVWARSNNVLNIHFSFYDKQLIYAFLVFSFIFVVPWRKIQ